MEAGDPLCPNHCEEGTSSDHAHGLVDLEAAELSHLREPHRPTLLAFRSSDTIAKAGDVGLEALFPVPSSSQGYDPSLGL